MGLLDFSRCQRILDARRAASGSKGNMCRGARNASTFQCLRSGRSIRYRVPPFEAAEAGEVGVGGCQGAVVFDRKSGSCASETRSALPEWSMRWKIDQFRSVGVRIRVQG